MKHTFQRYTDLTRHSIAPKAINKPTKKYRRGAKREGRGKVRTLHTSAAIFFFFLLIVTKDTMHHTVHNTFFFVVSTIPNPLLTLNKADSRIAQNLHKCYVPEELFHILTILLNRRYNRVH